MKCAQRIAACLLLGPSLALAVAQTDPWKQATLLFHKESIAGLEASSRAGDTASRLGVAVQLLNVMPKTSQNVERARALFEAVIAEGQGDYPLLARYYLGRIEQLHAFEPDLVAAKQHYLELFEVAPASLWGQLGALKGGTLKLYLVDEAGREVAIEEARHLLMAMTLPEIRRNFLHTLAEYLQLHGGDPKEALLYYEEARMIGFTRSQTMESLLLRIGKLAEDTEQPEIARRAWQQFVEEFPRHSHTYMIREKLAALEVER